MPPVALGKSNFGFIFQFSSYGEIFRLNQNKHFSCLRAYKTSIRNMQKLAKIQNLNAKFPHLNLYICTKSQAKHSWWGKLYICKKNAASGFTQLQKIAFASEAEKWAFAQSNLEGQAQGWLSGYLMVVFCLTDTVVKANAHLNEIDSVAMMVFCKQILVV